MQTDTHTRAHTRTDCLFWFSGQLSLLPWLGLPSEGLMWLSGGSVMFKCGIASRASVISASDGAVTSCYCRCDFRDCEAL